MEAPSRGSIADRINRSRDLVVVGGEAELRLARLLASEQLRSGEVSPAATEQAKQLIAELAAAAALHGRVRGRNLRLALTLDTAAGTLRIAVTAARRRTSPTRPRRSSSCGIGPPRGPVSSGP